MQTIRSNIRIEGRIAKISSLEYSGNTQTHTRDEKKIHILLLKMNAALIT